MIESPPIPYQIAQAKIEWFNALKARHEAQAPRPAPSAPRPPSYVPRGPGRWFRINPNEMTVTELKWPE